MEARIVAVLTRHPYNSYVVSEWLKRDSDMMV